MSSGNTVQPHSDNIAFGALVSNSNTGVILLCSFACLFTLGSAVGEYSEKAQLLTLNYGGVEDSSQEGGVGGLDGEGEGCVS
jgi:K+-transporting ATPase A subunit